MISCCTLAAYSQFNPRAPQPSLTDGSFRTLKVDPPKLRFVDGPSAQSAGLPDPLVESTVRVSLMFRFELVGLLLVANCETSWYRYLLRLVLTAVFPFPNTSQAIPSRGETSRQLGTFSMAANCRAGTNCPAGRFCAGRDSLSAS